jgi:glutaredoxin
MGFIFKPVRWVLAQLIIFIDWATRPKPLQRTPDAQQAVDQQTENMALYQFRQCPFCVRTRRQIHRLALNIETRDARNDPQWNRELVNDGGRYQVPCLKVVSDDGNVQWIYESREINQYLHDRFAANS